MTASTNTVAAEENTLGRPARPDRPRRYADDRLNDAYWARIIAIVDQAPPLSDEQRAAIRLAFHEPRDRRAAA